MDLDLMGSSPSGIFAQIKAEKGRLDIVCANAGVAKYAGLGEITAEVYDEIFNINVKGVLFTVQKALPLLPDGASIVLNASIVGSKGLAANSVYSATKAAVRSFARTCVRAFARTLSAELLDRKRSRGPAVPCQPCVELHAGRRDRGRRRQGGVMSHAAER
jgi:NAD(P)-dependent dehydrogenase (short-subunit alcohol dehydrogenase family)